MESQDSRLATLYLLPSTERPSPPSSRTADTRPTHVAFGSKVTIPDHILHCRQVRRGGGEIWRVKRCIYDSGILFSPPGVPAVLAVRLQLEESLVS